LQLFFEQLFFDVPWLISISGRVVHHIKNTMKAEHHHPDNLYVPARVISMFVVFARGGGSESVPR
jgi:RNase P/RNase MRP subunit p29